MKKENESQINSKEELIKMIEDIIKENTNKKQSGEEL